MILSDKVLREDERAVYKMRELYRSYGYLQYKVSKFAHNILGHSLLPAVNLRHKHCRENQMKRNPFE